MSNHLHIVVKLCPESMAELTDEAVAGRWTCLFSGPLLLQRWQKGEPLKPAELQAVKDCIAIYRKRLASLSWFMKYLNEPVARQANREDGCTGHFWEGRYKSQALLTEEALLSCMAYVDLNPIRAGMATTSEDSHHTSNKERIRPSFNLGEAVREQAGLQALIKFELPVVPLARFDGAVKEEEQGGILFGLTDYIELVDTTGRILKENKRGAIPNHLPPILQRLEIDEMTWLENAAEFERHYTGRFARPRRKTLVAA